MKAHLQQTRLWRNDNERWLDHRKAEISHAIFLSDYTPSYFFSVGGSGSKSVERYLGARCQQKYSGNQESGCGCLPVYAATRWANQWEIPSLGEVVTGKTDGVPMEIHRTKPSPGLTLSVTAEGPEVLIYKVARNGKPEGEGRMTLVENGKAWVDISWPAGQPQYAGEVVYVKQ